MCSSFNTTLQLLEDIIDIKTRWLGISPWLPWLHYTRSVSPTITTSFKKSFGLSSCHWKKSEKWDKSILQLKMNSKPLKRVANINCYVGRYHIWCSEKVKSYEELLELGNSNRSWSQGQCLSYETPIVVDHYANACRTWVQWKLYLIP